ncbi:MAG: response regulator [Phycisphaerales bacterium]|jgi:signal transduction histidine kinase/CheY-like chemotaxis protein/HPt (histidine-containing phosphotransfer) domain-containing protein
MTKNAKGANKTAATKKVADIMSRNVVTMRPDQSVSAAAKLMAKKNVSSVIVTENKVPIGIVTETDLVRKVVAAEKYKTQIPLSKIMSSPVISVPQDTTFANASSIMNEKSIKKLAIVDDGQIVGVITQTDILKAFETLLKEQTNLVKKQLEGTNQRLKEMHNEISHVSGEATLSDLAKNQFLASMSHEIRTPLNAIIGLSEVLAEEILTEEQSSHIGIIRESAQNMLVLINDILDFSKIEAGKFDIEIAECSLEHLLAVVESLMRPQAIQKGLDFGIFQNGELPARIKTDNLRLRQCLINLINNAIDFTDNGHVHVNIRLETINDQSYIRFDVEDTGTGISDEDQKKIFEQFSQLNTLPGRRRRGAGLGLTITKKLVSLLGGDVSVTSRVGSGSTFSLTIPVGVDAQTQQPLRSTDQLDKLKHEQRTLEQKQFSGRVLVAEDTPTNQTLIRLLLEKLGLEVTITQDGKEAVEAALSQDFDMVMMDIQMPVMNGHDATKKLRKEGYTKPIVAVTAHAMKGDKEKCLASGCNDYLSKPINRKELVEIIGKYLPQKTKDLSEKVDSVTAEVKELTQMCKNTGDASAESNGTLPADNLVDWESVMSICDDEDVIKQVVEMFLKDSPKCLNSLAEAIKSANPKHIKMYAHSMKGASIQIGAKRLSDIALKLEHAGRDKDMEHVPEMFNELQDEYSKLTLFLSQPNWIELAKNGQSRNPHK